MKNTDCYFYFEHYDMGAHISCCTFKEYPLGKCPCDDCTNYVPQSKVSQIVREYLEHKAIPSAYKGMTNGEVIKAVFPNTKIITQYDNSFGDRFMVFELDNKMSQEVYLDWWNSPYEPQESEE